MRVNVMDRGLSRTLDAYALPAGEVIVSDWEVTLLVGLPRKTRDEWTAARCAAWRAAHGGAK
jgi:hypothetical protein